MKWKNKKGASPTIKDRLHARLGHKYNTFLLKDHIMTKEFSSIMELKAIREQKSRLNFHRLYCMMFHSFLKFIPGLRMLFQRQTVRQTQIALCSARSFFSLCCSCLRPVCWLEVGCRTESGRKLPVCSRMSLRV